jgi:hypothetical protein
MDHNYILEVKKSLNMFPIQSCLFILFTIIWILLYFIPENYPTLLGYFIRQNFNPIWFMVFFLMICNWFLFYIKNIKFLLFSTTSISFSIMSSLSQNLMKLWNNDNYQVVYHPLSIFILTQILSQPLLWSIPHLIRKKNKYSKYHVLSAFLLCAYFIIMMVTNLCVELILQGNGGFIIKYKVDPDYGSWVYIFIGLQYLSVFSFLIMAGVGCNHKCLIINHFVFFAGTAVITFLQSIRLNNNIIPIQV